MNKSIKKCCVCNNNEIGEFIMINNNKYHLLCIEKIQKDKQELIDYLKEKINSLKLKGCNYEKTYICGKIKAYEEILSKIEKE